MRKSLTQPSTFISTQPFTFISSSRPLACIHQEEVLAADPELWEAWAAGYALPADRNIESEGLVKARVEAACALPHLTVHAPLCRHSCHRPWTRLWIPWTLPRTLESGEDSPAPHHRLSRLRSIADIHDAHPGATVVVCSHGALIKCLLGASVGNASVTVLSVEGGGEQRVTWRAERIGDDSHLPKPGLRVSGM